MHKPFIPLTCLLAVLLLALPAAAHAQRGQRATGQILAVNDFHGHLEPNTPGTITEETGATPIPAGGAEYLATTIRTLRRERPRNTLTVSAGDLIGGSPLVSALFHDEPTIEAWNRMRLDLASVGNHEFDDGIVELRRMQNGGCHPDGCVDRDGDGRTDPFDGAEFQFLAANVVRQSTGRPVFPPFAIRRLAGVDVGFIGLTLEGTPAIVAAAGIRGLVFRDEADTINRYTRVLRRQHDVEAIVVLLHEGGFQTTPFNINGCNGLTGAVVDIVNRTRPAVDLFITGHTHQPYDCVVDDRPVTSAFSFGRLLTDLDVTVDRRTGDFVRIEANNVIVRQTAADGTPVRRAPDISALVRRYQTLAAPLAERPVGRLSGPATRTPDDSGEHAAGNLIADSQLAATDNEAGAVAAFMNTGGVRSDFPAGDVSYGAAFTVQPFGNTLTTMTLTGAQVLEMLKQQWCGQTAPRVLLPSSTVAYSYSAAAAAAATGQPCAGAANPVTALTIGGQPVDPAAPYRITVNSFLAGGGDLFTILREGTALTGGLLDLDALQAYMAPSLTGAPLAVPATDRITLEP
jgi:5'-nucleotidase